MGSSTSHLASATPISTESDISKLKIPGFEVDRLLGKGTFGAVYAARRKNHEEFIALKIVERRSNQHPQDHRQAIKQETRIMKTLHQNSPFALAFYGSFPCGSGTALMLELVSGGDLQSKLRDSDTGSNIAMHEDDARFYVAEIACALEFLRLRKIVHRDLKLDNILLTHDGHIKIADYGIATFIVGGHVQTPHGTWILRPPQMLRGEPYTAAADWYALGVIMYELVVGYDPFSNLECPYHYQDDPCSLSCVARIILGTKLDYPSSLSADGHDLISSLMKDDEKERIKSLEEISRHPWFAGIDWKSFKSGNGQTQMKIQ